MKRRTRVTRQYPLLIPTPYATTHFDRTGCVLESAHAHVSFHGDRLHLSEDLGKPCGYEGGGVVWFYDDDQPQRTA